jgi:hypothetical protein
MNNKADQFLPRHKIGTKKIQGMTNNVIIHEALSTDISEFLIKTDQQEGISLEI